MFVKLLLSTIIAIVIAIFLIYEYVYKFYSKVKLYPRGPKPLPIIGNFLMLRKCLDQHLCYFFKDLANKYGDSYTFWLGTKPIVIINGISLAKEAFNKNEFCDRCEPSLLSQINQLFGGSHKAFAFMNIDEQFKQLRHLSAQSIRKFLFADRMSKITHEIVFDTVNEMKKREIGDAFVPIKYIESIFIRLIAELTFGKKIPFDDHLIEKISVYFEALPKKVIRLFVAHFSAIYKYFDQWTQNSEPDGSLFELFNCWYKSDVQHCKNDDNFGNIGEALDSIANYQRTNCANKSQQHLNESNMIGSLIIMFIGASDATQGTFKWILLLMAYYPEMQQKMRNEINNNIGNNKIADLNDKQKCVYVNAFLCETLRFRNVTHLSVPHMTSNDIILGDISIPKGTTILLNQFSILNDSRYWKNPDVFNPERFIDREQNLVASNISSFIPFSTGKWMCIGDKFAMNTLFLVLASLLQATNGMKFVIPGQQSADLKPSGFGLFLKPKLFKVCLVKE